MSPTATIGGAYNETMLTTAMLMLSLAAAQGETKLQPTDDVWVYQFAEDQTTDPYLRIWSSDGQAVGDSFEGHLTFSYSCLKFDVSKLEGKVKSAKLILTHTEGASYTEADSKTNPIEVRTLPNDWNESSWQYEKATKIHPVKDPGSIFGVGSGNPAGGDKEFTITVDLMAGPSNFATAVDEARKSSTKTLAVSLTSKLSPEGQGEGFVYKFFSRSSSDEAKRPQLVIETE